MFYDFFFVFLFVLMTGIKALGGLYTVHNKGVRIKYKKT